MRCNRCRIEITADKPRTNAWGFVLCVRCHFALLDILHGGRKQTLKALKGKTNMANMYKSFAEQSRVYVVEAIKKLRAVEPSGDVSDAVELLLAVSAILGRYTDKAIADRIREYARQEQAREHKTIAEAVEWERCANLFERGKFTKANE